jgi:hypothetical protein
VHQSLCAVASLLYVDEDGVAACPVSVTLGYLQGVLPEGIASAWLVAIARRAFQLYVARLLALHRTRDSGRAGRARTLACGEASTGSWVAMNIGKAFTGGRGGSFLAVFKWCKVALRLYSY